MFGGGGKAEEEEQSRGTVKGWSEDRKTRQKKMTDGMYWVENGKWEEEVASLVITGRSRRERAPVEREAESRGIYF